jgi:putative peptidoglycan lipid II flippase
VFAKLRFTARNLINRKQTNILSAASIIMAMVFTSRVLGLVRDRLLTGKFPTNELGVYFASFRLPNLIFEMLVVGTVSTAFIPVFSEYLVKKSKRDAFSIASSVINLSSLLVLLLIIPLLVFTPTISRFFAPGFNPTQISDMTYYTRILLIAQILPLLVGNFLTGVLQSYKHFLLPAIAPVVYNLGTIIGIVFLSPYFGLFGVILGVVLGAFFFLAIQIPQVKALKYRHFFVFDYKKEGVAKIFKLAIPRTLSLGISQIDLTIDLILASVLGASSIAVFTFAQHLQQVPVGLFGLTISQATLPTLSQYKQMKSYKDTFLASWHQIIFLVLPASVILAVLRIPAVRLVFGSARFDWEATVLTAKTLSFFAISLFAQASVHLFIRAFFSLQDSKTPVVTSTIAVLTNSILSIYFVLVLNLPIWSLGLSASIAAIVNAGLLLFLLNRKVGGFGRYNIIIPPLKMLIAASFAGISIYVPLKLFDQLVFDTTRTFNLILLTGTVTFIGLSVYGFMAWFLNIKEVLTFYNLLKRVIRVRDIILDTTPEVVHGEETI